ncbi:hypothetical protein [Kribbella deserti]|uniref:Uncharacterized protein n=1 Tax=Kribbella deserti TaxID=1926257 RepID=A0ABV6QPT4_9ACTN
MIRKIIAGATALAAVTGFSVMNAPAANAYAYWKNGYFYGDTSYSNNVPGVYAKVVGRRDVGRQLYYMTLTLTDTRTDSQRGALRVRGYDKTTGKWLAYYSLAMVNGNAGTARPYSVTFSTAKIDRIILQDGIYGKTYGTNSVTLFNR